MFCLEFFQYVSMPLIDVLSFPADSTLYHLLYFSKFYLDISFNKHAINVAFAIALEVIAYWVCRVDTLKYGFPKALHIRLMVTCSKSEWLVVIHHSQMMKDFITGNIHLWYLVRDCPHPYVS